MTVKKPPVRKIIHIDMDAFFASVEQRDYPEYRGKPVAVGGSKARGVVAAASYEARKFGVHSAMPSVIAKRKCPQLIFVKVHFDVYKSVSGQIMDIFRTYTDLVEPLSLDEAYLDVTINKYNNPSATMIAKEIRARIKAETKLTASAGVSINKFIAKVASDMDKPDGLTVITPDEVTDFLEKLAIEKFYGVGKVTANKMKKLGIHNGADLKKWEKVQLLNQFGIVGDYYYNVVRGFDDRQVKTHRDRKSIGAERTFSEDINEKDLLIIKLRKIVEILVKRLQKYDKKGKTVTLKIKYHDFIQQTRSQTLNNNVHKFEELLAIANELLHTPHFPDRAVRLLGLSVSNLSKPDVPEKAHQLMLDI